MLFLRGGQRTNIAGWICASFAFSCFVAPLSIIVSWHRRKLRYDTIATIIILHGKLDLLQKQVIRTKSVEYMPISLSFFLTVSAIAWLSYGLLLGDLHVAVSLSLSLSIPSRSRWDHGLTFRSFLRQLPNVVGFLFGVAQIIIYLVYKNAKKDDTKTKLGNQAAEAMATAVTSGSDIELPEKLSTPQAEV